MAGIGRNARGSKRGSSASASYSCASTVTMVVFVAVCLLGVWMITPSSIIPSRAASRLTGSFAAPSRPLLDKTAEVSSQDVGSGAEDLGSKSESKVGEEFEENRQGALPDETSEAAVQHEPDPDPDPEPVGRAATVEESQQQDPQEKSDGDGEHNQHQEEHDSSGTVDENQQENEVQQQEQELSKTEHTESQSGQGQGTGDTNNVDENDQVESSREENQQQIQTETEVTQNQEQQQQETTEERADNGQSESEATEGNTEESPLHSGKAEATETQDQSDDIKEQDSAGSQQQAESEDQQQTSHQHMEAENHVATGEETQQQGEEALTDPNVGESLPDGAQSEVSNEGDAKKRPWATQEDHSENEKERQKEESQLNQVEEIIADDTSNPFGYEWELCNVTAGPDYIPCLDNQKAIKKLHSFGHYEHRERHCPEESPSCLVPVPEGYKRSIEWPKSRDRIWYNNIPHTKLAQVKGHQNWVKVTGEYLTFPGGGTQFIHGALHYIDFIQQSQRDIAWGKHTRVILDVGCGVASFGGYLFERDVLAMSFAPKDEHEAQVQFALERGIPAISAVMGTQRLQFPSRVFDLVHCARCRVPWHADGGRLLLELNRVLRPGGYFVWSATPVYQKLKEDAEIWKAMSSLTKSMCWDLVTIKKDKLNSVAAAFYRKPTSNECYDSRKQNTPPMCKEDDDPNAAWYIPLQTCMHRVPVDGSERGSRWPEVWPKRVEVPPYWLNNSQIGVYGRPAPEDFVSDYEHWKRVVKKSYLGGLGISWSKVRNVMDMRAVYGGFAAALKDLKVWVMNVVNIDAPDTLPIIYERGFFGMYHDWCESFSTYPRTYDLLHADHLFSRLKKRCNILPVMAEIDRIVRPGGKLIVRDESTVVSEVENLLKSLHWEVRLTFSKVKEGILCAEKSDWRPEKYAYSS